MKTTKEKIAEVIAHAIDLHNPLMKESLTEYLAQAALDVVCKELVSIPMANASLSFYNESRYGKEKSDIYCMADALKAVADKLRG